jgi:hypothetical protein
MLATLVLLLLEAEAAARKLVGGANLGGRAGASI